MSSTLAVDRPADGVLGVWMNRPDRRNAIDATLVDALHEAFTGVDARVVVLGSTDPRCFSAGADLSMTDEQRRYVSDRLHKLYERLLSLQIPVVVAITGPAVGGGAQLALAGDLRVGSPTARLRFVGAGHGVAVGAWGLPSLVGRGRALDLCLTMRWVDAEEALAVGLLNRVAEDARAAALDLARGLTRLDPGAVARVKTLVVRQARLAEAVNDERAGNAESWTGSMTGLEAQDGAQDGAG